MHAKAETSNEKRNIKRQKTSHEFVKNKSIEDVAKLACAEGLNFNRIANNPRIQECFKEYNCDKASPSNPVSEKSNILKYATK